MKLRWLVMVVFVAAAAIAQDSARPGTIVPQGASIPGLSGVPGMEGGGFIEGGGSRSDLTSPMPSWTDFYLRGVVTPFATTGFDGEATHQNRYGSAGTFYSVGVTHTFGSNVYADVHAGTSSGGFFLPKLRTDGFINFKALARKQLVLSAGAGYDKSKT